MTVDKLGGVCEDVTVGYFYKLLHLISNECDMIGLEVSWYTTGRLR
jgi:hypothetical protein